MISERCWWGGYCSSFRWLTPGQAGFGQCVSFAITPFSGFAQLAANGVESGSIAYP